MEKAQFLYYLLPVKPSDYNWKGQLEKFCWTYAGTTSSIHFSLEVKLVKKSLGGLCKSKNGPRLKPSMFNFALKAATHGEKPAATNSLLNF